MRTALLALAIGLAIIPTVLAQSPPKPDKPAAVARSPLGGLGGTGKEPIKIDADRLDVFDKEQRAVFSGNVVAVQGDTTMRCAALTVLYDQSAAKSQGAAPQPAAAQGAAAQDGGIRKLDCKGPVTVVSKEQTATADNASFDKAANIVVLSGNAILSQGQNITKGDRIVYDLTTSTGKVETKPGGRVQSVLVPGGNDPADKNAKPRKPDAKPADTKPAPGTN